MLERDGADPVPGISMAVVTNSAPWTYLGGRPLNPTPQASFDAGLDLFALTGLGLSAVLRHLAEITLSTNGGPRGGDVFLLHDQPDSCCRVGDRCPYRSTATTWANDTG